MDERTAGLRSQDVHAGLRNVDPASGTLAPLMTTRLIGMAGTLAAFIRGRDVIQDASALQAVAAEQLDVDLYAFNEVIGILESIGVVDGVQRARSGKVLSFTETIPYYESLHGHLGEAWRDREPTQLEEEMVSVVDHLAGGPIPREELVGTLGLDIGDVGDLLELGKSSHLVKTAAAVDGELLYSPFYAFENPQAMDELVAEHGADRLAEEFNRLRDYQGLPVSDDAFPALSEAIRRGFVLAPSVNVPGGELQPFASLPYVLERSLLTVRKPVLEKALAVVACLRCGQHFGGYTALSPSQLVNIIDKFLDPTRGMLEPHSSHERQYQLMHRAGLVMYDPDPMPGGRWVVPRFVDTPDNREALNIARDLLLHGERMDDRLGIEDARRLLNQSGGLAGPMQTISRLRGKAPIDTRKWSDLVEMMMGRRAR